ncbi:MAG TPA: hypothetical protein ENN73_01445 [Firmicutes bacterium]|nr:hypothetical protein [Bacillota bacterium]
MIPLLRQKAADYIRDFFYLNKFNDYSVILNELDSKLDRRFISNLILGVFKEYLLLRYHIRRYLDYKKPLPPFIESNLIVGGYQLFFMDKTPSYSIINETVEIIKRSPDKKFTGLVNAVLRRLERVSGRSPTFLYEGIDLTGPDLISLKYSHPLWLVNRWISEFGFENAEEYCRFNQKSYPHFIRANLLKSGTEELRKFLEDNSVEFKHTDTRGVFLLPGGIQDILNSEFFLSGKCIIQDESSVIIGRLAAAEISGDFLDLCSAPGLKTQIIKEEKSGKITIHANEVDPVRFQEMKDNLIKWCVNDINLLNLDALEFPEEFLSRFKTVLIDAPCSNLGVIAAKPDIRWRRTENDLHDIAGLQLEILRRGSELCSDGGIVIYVTCSIEREETEDVIDKFLSANKNFFLEEPASVPAFADCTGKSGFMLRFLPFKIHKTGFFIVKLRKR